MTDRPRNHPLRVRRFLELAAGLALIGTAVGVALADDFSPSRRTTSAAAPAPIQLGAAADEASTRDHSASKYRLRIPNISVDAPIVSVDIDDDGVLGVPGDPGEIGWWAEGPAPGSEQGTSILAGHVNTARRGPGALRALEQVQPDDLIIVEGWDGPATFQVTEIVRYRRGEIPASAFDQRGSGRLALVSCTDLNEETGVYRDNLVVYATLQKA